MFVICLRHFADRDWLTVFMESCINENISYSFQSCFFWDNIKVLVNKIRFAATYLLLLCRDDFWASVV
jgi:hypothetical protein